jgi:monothiol glutaredoxin
MSEQEILKAKIAEQVKTNKVVIYMKGTQDFPQCGFSAQAIQVLKATTKEPIYAVDVLSDDPLWGALEEFTQWPTVPQIFITGEFIGGCDILTELHERGELQKLVV